jgi:aspartate racemase
VKARSAFLEPDKARVGQAHNRVIARLAERGCDAVALACTEIPLLVRASDAPLPTLDSTRLLAIAALREALT